MTTTYNCSGRIISFIHYPSVALSQHESSLQRKGIRALKGRQHALMDDTKEADRIDLSGGSLAVSNVIPRAHANECGDNTRDEDVHQERIPAAKSLLW